MQTHYRHINAQEVVHHIFYGESSSAATSFGVNLHIYFFSENSQLLPIFVLTLGLLVSSADNIFNQFGPRSGSTKRRA